MRSIVVYFRDITADLNREKKIAESERAFRTMMESMDDIVYTLDRDLRCTAVYGTWIDRMGLTAEKLIGRTAVESMG